MKNIVAMPPTYSAGPARQLMRAIAHGIVSAMPIAIVHSRPVASRRAADRRAAPPVMMPAIAPTHATDSSVVAAALRHALVALEKVDQPRVVAAGRERHRVADSISQRSVADPQQLARACKRRSPPTARRERVAGVASLRAAGMRRHGQQRDHDRERDAGHGEHDDDDREAER